MNILYIRNNLKIYFNQYNRLISGCRLKEPHPYFLFGFLIRNEKNFFKINAKKGFIITTILYLAFSYMTSFLGYQFNAKYFTKLALLFTHRYSPVMIVDALFLFYIFADLKFTSKYINKLANFSLAVYLIHENPLLIKPLWSNIFDYENIYASKLFIFYIIFIPIAIFLICSIIDFFRIHLTKPVIAKLSNLKLINKIDKYINS